jgi:hypothetical protein
MTNTGKLPPDAWQRAMNAAMPKYTGEQTMQDANKNPLDTLIKPRKYEPPENAAGVPPEKN